MREEEAHQVDQGQSDSNTDEDGDVIVEEHRRVAPPVRRPLALPYPRRALRKLSMLWM